MQRIDPQILTVDLISSLTSVDTPTICNALEVVSGTRTNSGFTRGNFVAAHAEMKPVLGFARTAKLRTAHPYSDSLEDIKARRLAWYEHLESRGVPTICVMEDIDEQPGLGAFWGEVHSHVLKGLGVKGVLTNGALRDLGMLAEDFQILASSISPSHGYAQVMEVGSPVEVHALSIHNGDLLHMDRHGAVIIPPEALLELPRCIDIIVRKERPLIEAAQKPGFSVEALRAAMAMADDIH